MKQVAFGIKYIWNYQLLHKHTPLICGITMTNNCNLRCRHCRVPERGARKMSFAKIGSIIDAFYQQGGRTLYLQGGEPFLWHDGEHTLEDVVQYSRNVGFLATIIYTNGTFPLKTTADTIFASIDGLQKTHDYLRGETFNKILKNIRESHHPSLYINFTINQYNKNEILDFCTFIEKIDHIRGVFFYFHTPYYGYDDLYLEPDERNKIIKKLILSKKKYKILNSSAGLKSALRNDWKRPLNICQVYEEGKLFECCRTNRNAELCQNCGYLSYAEIDQTLKLKPSAILNALKYF